MTTKNQFTYQAIDPNTEAIGGVMLGFIAGVRKDDIQPYLVKHNLTDIKPDVWYKQQRFLDVMTDMLAESGDYMAQFVSIGMNITETAPLPQGFIDLPLEEKYLAWNDGYQANHRNGDAGSISAEIIGKNHVRMDVAFAYPDHLEYGAYYGLARRFLPKGTHFTVQYEDPKVRRELGALSTVYMIKWD